MEESEKRVDGSAVVEKGTAREETRAIKAGEPEKASDDAKEKETVPHGPPGNSQDGEGAVKESC